jgi:hypothetical protein
MHKNNLVCCSRKDSGSFLLLKDNLRNMWNNIELLTSDDTGSGCLSVGSRKENVTALYQADLLGKISSEKVMVDTDLESRFSPRL